MKKTIPNLIYCFLNYFTLNVAIKIFYSVHYHKRAANIIYYGYLVWLNMCLLRLVHAFFNYNLDQLQRLEPWAMIIINITKSKFIFVSFGCYLIHTFNVLNFNSRLIVSVLEEHSNDFLELMILLFEKEICILDYLFGRDNKKKLKQLSHKLKSFSNGFLMDCDVERIAWLCQIVDASYFVTMFTLFSSLMIFIPI